MKISGSFVVEYCGEICSESQFKKRARKYAKANMKHHYFMKMAVNEVKNGRAFFFTRRRVLDCGCDGKGQRVPIH